MATRKIEVKRSSTVCKVGNKVGNSAVLPANTSWQIGRPSAVCTTPTQHLTISLHHRRKLADRRPDYRATLLGIKRRPLSSHAAS